MSNEKVCYLLRIDPEHIDEYLERHRQVWPGLLNALRSASFNNYSVFLDETGLLVVYLETDDYASGAAFMSSAPIQQAWSEYLNAMFRDVDPSRPVGVIRPLVHAFDLDRQLAEVNR
jgi:L-rhamnose mutarotase